MPLWVLLMLITDILLPLVPARFWLTKFLFSTTIKSVRHKFKIKGRAAADIAIFAVWHIIYRFCSLIVRGLHGETCSAKRQEMCQCLLDATAAARKAGTPVFDFPFVCWFLLGQSSDKRPTLKSKTESRTCKGQLIFKIISCFSCDYGKQ